ncbi:MAG: transglycosylase domain-containing protein, partial [Firmicutes bacterium]|nr:transglycosylase domain-containing protein [Bacillota bacterium]
MSRSEKKKTHGKASNGKEGPVTGRRAAKKEKSSIGDALNKAKQRRQENAARKAAEKRAVEIDKAAAAAEENVANMHNQKGTAKKKSKKKKGWKTWSIKKKILLSVLGIFLAIFIVCCIYAAVIIAQAPKINPDNIYAHVAQQSTLYDKNGKIIESVFVSGGNRKNVEYKQLPEDLVNAIVSIEDKKFWTHNGFNFWRMMGAIKEGVFGGGKVTGTSTITQQLARNVYLAESKSARTIKRKVTEAYYTVRIEHELSKEKIMEAYMNTIYLGYGSYGVRTAAKTYFSKNLKDLDLIECAALAALPQMPDSYALVKVKDVGSVSKNDPDLLYYDDTTAYVYNGDASKDRRERTLQNMKDEGYITEKQMKKALKEDLRDHIKIKKHSASSYSSYFTDYCIDELTEDIMKEYNYSYEDARDMIYTGGLKIYTTMSKRMQKIVTKEFDHTYNFPYATNFRYDGNRNILDKYGHVLLYDYDNMFNSRGSYMLNKGDYKWLKKGGLKLYAGKRLNFYDTETDNGNEIVAQFKPMWLYDKDGIFSSIESGTIDLPSKYLSKDKNGNLIISRKFTKSKRGKRFFVKKNGQLLIRKKHYSIKEPVKQPQAAMVIIDNKTGGIRAMVGGRDIKGKMLYNRALSPRQPGSSIKPLAMYSSAIQLGEDAANAATPMVYNGSDTGQYGNFLTASSMIHDAPIKGRDDWPKNWYTGYKGYMTLRKSVEQSVNVNAVRVYDEVGSDYAISQLKKYGITSLVEGGTVNDENPAALALGGMTKGISPLELASAYSTFPNKGIHKSPLCYTKVCNSKGEVLFRSKQTKKRVISEGTAFIMTDILHTTVTRGLGVNANIGTQPVAGKTGTTSDNYDMWFAGFTPKYSAALWWGNDVNIELTGTSNNSASLWGKIMRQITAGTKWREFPSMPDTVVKVGSEFYIAGTQPGYTFYDSNGNAIYNKPTYDPEKKKK